MTLLKFKWLSGDVNWKDYGGSWVSKKLNNGDFDYWFVMTLFNWEDQVGAREAAEIGSKYCVDMRIVAPSEPSQEQIASALSCVGDERKWSDIPDLEKVVILSTHGTYVTIFSQSGDSYSKLFKLAKEKATGSALLTFGFDMDKPMNAIGSTGWDAVRGDIMAGLRRHQDTPEQKLMGKLSGIAPEGTSNA